MNGRLFYHWGTEDERVKLKSSCWRLPVAGVVLLTANTETLVSPELIIADELTRRACRENKVWCKLGMQADIETHSDCTHMSTHADMGGLVR